MTAEEGRWDYVEGDEPTQHYDSDELERARLRMKGEKDKLDKDQDLFISPTNNMDYQEGQEEIDGHSPEEMIEREHELMGEQPEPEEQSVHDILKKEFGNEEEDEGWGDNWGDPEDTAKDIYDLGHPEADEELSFKDGKKPMRAYPNEDVIGDEGGAGSGRKPEGGASLMPEQIGMPNPQNYDPYRATPKSDRLQTDPELTRMTEEAPDDIDPIFGKEYDDEEEEEKDLDEDKQLADDDEWERIQPKINLSEAKCPECGDTFSSDTMVKHLTDDHQAHQYDFMKGSKWGEEDVSVSGPPVGDTIPANGIVDDEEEESPIGEGQWVDDDHYVNPPTVSDIPDIAKSMAKGYYNQLKHSLQETPQWEKDLEDLSEVKATESVTSWWGGVGDSEFRMEALKEINADLDLAFNDYWELSNEIQDELFIIYSEGFVGAEESNTEHEPAGSGKGGQFATKGGGDSGGKHSDKSIKDLIKSIKGGSKDWNDWGRNEKTEDAYAEIERRNKEIPHPKRPEGSGGSIFRDDPDAVSKMEAKVKYLEDVADYWKEVTKFPHRDYHNHDQLGDAKFYAMSNNSANLRDAKNKLAGIKAQQASGTQLVRKTTYKSDQYGKSKPRFYYSEEPKKTHDLTGDPMEDLKTLSMFTQGDTVEIDALTKKQRLKLHGLMKKEKGYGVNGSNDAEMKQFWNGLTPQERLDFGAYPKEHANKEWDDFDGKVSVRDETGHVDEGGSGLKGSYAMMVNKTNEPTMSDYWLQLWTDKGKPDYSGMESYVTEAQKSGYIGCPHCNQEFSNVQYLKDHIDEQHEGKESKANEVSYDYNDIGGEKRKVTYTDNRGNQTTGNAVMKGPAGWVVNSGNQAHPELVDETNFISVESKATEGQVSSDTWYSDYSEYWKKGDSYVRSGLTLQAGIPTDWVGTEWDDLPADVQAKIRDAGYVTSYETYDKMSWEFLPKDIKQKLGEGLIRTTESEWDTSSNDERKEIIEENDIEVPLLTQLLDNELQEEEEGHDETEDIALIAQLIGEEANWTQFGHTSNPDFRTNCVDGEPHIPKEDKQIDECVKCGKTILETGDGSSYWFTDEDQREWDRVYNESHKKKAKEVGSNPNPSIDDSYRQFVEPTEAPTGKTIVDQTYGVSEPETPDGQDLTGITIGDEITKEEILGDSMLPFADLITKKITGEADKEYERIRGLIEMSEMPETVEDIDRWAVSWGADKDLVHRVFDEQFGTYEGDEENKLDFGDKDEEELEKISYGEEGEKEDLEGYHVNPDYSEEYDPIGEPDAMVTDDDKILDFFKQTGDEEIIEKTPPKIEYLYYKQYPFGRRAGKQNPFGEVYYGSDQNESGRGWYCNTCNTEFESHAGAKAHGDVFTNHLVREYSLADQAKHDVGEVRLDTMNKARIWWDNKYPERQWSDMRIGDRQNAILAFLNDPTTTLNEGGQGSGRKPFKSEDPKTKDKAHIGWKNYGIDDYIDKAEKEYLEGKEFDPSILADPTPWASLAHLAGTTVKDILFPAKEENPNHDSGTGKFTSGSGGSKYPEKPEGLTDKEYGKQKKEYDDSQKVRSDRSKNTYAKKKWSSLTPNQRTLFTIRKGFTFDSRKEGDDFTNKNMKGDFDKLPNHLKNSFTDNIDSYRGNEGGLGSGKKDHKGWMRAIEEEHEYNFCDKCSMITEQVNKKCQMCGKRLN